MGKRSEEKQAERSDNASGGDRLKETARTGRKKIAEGARHGVEAVSRGAEHTVEAVKKRPWQTSGVLLLVAAAAAGAWLANRHQSR